MSSDEERLEEMLRAVMEAEETAGSDPDEWEIRGIYRFRIFLK